MKIKSFHQRYIRRPGWLPPLIALILFFAVALLLDVALRYCSSVMEAEQGFRDGFEHISPYGALIARTHWLPYVPLVPLAVSILARRGRIVVLVLGLVLIGLTASWICFNTVVNLSMYILHGSIPD